jgi:hypothetical protein
MVSVGKRALLVGGALLGAMVLATPAAAQATRTWVSGVGDDANPCSRTAPCKTFAGAISKTAAGGEINCLDPGGYGAVTITKAIAILCDHTEAGVLVAATNGFIINAGDADVVTISGIDIFGPSGQPGLNGIRFINGAGLNVRNTTINGFNTQGISFEVGTGDTSFLNLDNVILTGNGSTSDATTSGVRIAPGTNATANFVLNNTRIQDSRNAGLRLDLTGTTGTRINGQITGSVISNSGIGMLLKALPGTGTINLSVDHMLISGNASNGVVGNGSGVGARFADTTISGNGAGSAAAATGVTAVNGAVLSSYGDNHLAGNFNNTNTLANGAFSGTIPPN